RQAFVSFSATIRGSVMGLSRARCPSAGRFRRIQIVFLRRANRPSERGELRALLFANRAVRWRKEGKRETHWKRALPAAAQEASALHKILSRTRAVWPDRILCLAKILWRTRASAPHRAPSWTRARRAGTLAPHRIVSQAKILCRTRAWRAWAPAPHSPHEHL